MLLIAKTFQGLEDVLAKELTDLGALEVTTGTRMVSFKGDKRMLYKANFCCRTALKILKPIVSFKAQDTDELYEEAKKFAWDTLLNVNDTFSIDSTVNSDEFRHSKFVVYRVKDAIADYFSEKFNKRPSIRLVNADIQLNVHIFNNEVTISLDSSGEPLFKRGYRVEQTEAPINEVLAAGLLLKAGWDGQSNLIDPMCGSGTLLIEAALIARNIAPGVFRQAFAFEKWPDFDAELWSDIYNDDSQEHEFTHKIYGSDASFYAIQQAAKNIKSAGVQKDIDLRQIRMEEIKNPFSLPCAGEELCSIGLPVAVRRTPGGGVVVSFTKSYAVVSANSFSSGVVCHFANFTRSASCSILLSLPYRSFPSPITNDKLPLTNRGFSSFNVSSLVFSVLCTSKRRLIYSRTTSVSSVWYSLILPSFHIFAALMASSFSKATSSAGRSSSGSMGASSVSLRFLRYQRTR